MAMIEATALREKLWQRRLGRLINSDCSGQSAVYLKKTFGE
jgi:hypothetical protein